MLKTTIYESEKGFWWAVLRPMFPNRRQLTVHDQSTGLRLCSSCQSIVQVFSFSSYEILYCCWIFNLKKEYLMLNLYIDSCVKSGITVIILHFSQNSWQTAMYLFIFFIGSWEVAIICKVQRYSQAIVAIPAKSKSEKVLKNKNIYFIMK